MSLFQTNNQGLASTLLYVLGPQSLRKTVLENEGHSKTFHFDNHSGLASGVVRSYFAGQHAIDDARSFVECFVGIRRSIRAAFESGGVWENQDECN